jgi:hypothetical protein
VLKGSFIELPVVLKKFEVRIIKGFLQMYRVIVVNFAKTIEFVLRPVPLIG